MRSRRQAVEISLDNATASVYSSGVDLEGYPKESTPEKFRLGFRLCIVQVEAL